MKNFPFYYSCLIGVILSLQISYCHSEETVDWGYYYQPGKSVVYKVAKNTIPDLQRSFQINSIGKELMWAGRYDEALQFYQQALQLRAKALGRNHPFTTSIINNIGLTYDLKKDYPNAEKYFKEASEIQFKYGFKGSPDKKMDITNLIKLYKKEGKLKIAEALQKRYDASEASSH